MKTSHAKKTESNPITPAGNPGPRAIQSIRRGGKIGQIANNLASRKIIPNPFVLCLPGATRSYAPGTHEKSNECFRLQLMSASGPKRTSLVAPHMSAFGGKVDMPGCTAHVCF